MFKSENVNPLTSSDWEEQITNYWEQEHIFERSISERPENNSYVFYDGPPFATGTPHYGHIVASTMKDVVPRYKTMKGYRVERKWGWDCHGLPVENIVEKELNLKDKAAIESFGVGNFNDACKTAVLRYVDEWKVVIRNLGRWVDMENDYKTMEPWYMESLWWVFKQLWERQLIYRGHKSMHICPRCETPLSNFEVTQGYKDVKDISVFVTFQLQNRPEKIIAWTTTPWTLPGNVLLAVNNDIEYVTFELPSKQGQYIAAKDLLPQLTGDETPQIINSMKGRELVGLQYIPLFPYFKDTPNAFRIVSGDFVSLEEGSGIVHIAPAFGEDDYAIGKAEQIPLIQHVGMDGKFKSTVTDFANLQVKPKDNPLETDILIIRYLAEKDLLFSKQNVTHSYPHCWRCDTPLINYATDSWFVKVTQFKQELLNNNQKITWIPEHIKNGRFGDWLENARDWAISRNRFWGTPLPIWIADDGETICIGSIKELEELSGQKIDNIHKQYVDSITFERNGKLFKRIPEVLDCWFESGAMPYASFHYPFENKEKFEATFPAEFISEGQDQTRGWFYTLHVLATALTLGENPAIPSNETTSSFRNCIVTGIVLAEDGKKMSKRLKNYPDPEIIGQKYGYDALRMYLMSSSVIKAENLNFSEKGVDEIKKKFINITWNVYSFLKLYDQDDIPPMYPKDSSYILDRWLISLTEQMTEKVEKAMESYDLVTASRLLIDFVNPLSTWYLRISRDRLRDPSSNRSSLQTLKAVLYRFSLLIAPFTPHFAELIYQNTINHDGASVHLESYPKADVSRIDNDLVAAMEHAQTVVTLGHAARKSQNISVKQPLAKISVNGMNELSVDITNLILQELNIKQIVWDSTPQSEIGVVLDTQLSDELIEEGKAREIIRQIQSARKNSGTRVDEYITVELSTWPKLFETEIKQKVKANQLNEGPELKIIRLDEVHS